MTILLRLAYDGTDFSGYQVQHGRRREGAQHPGLQKHTQHPDPQEDTHRSSPQEHRTVQGVVEDALAAIHRSPVPTVCAGRTDAGVHAVGQYLSFETDHQGIPPNQFAAALNSHLPRDVRATGSWEREPPFHARYDALRRHYRYYLYISPWDLPHRRRYAWRLPAAPSLDALNEDVRHVLGTHDFTTFAARRGGEGTMVRTVDTACFVVGSQEETLEFHISANGFLWRMVRSIVGTCIARERARQRGNHPGPPVDALVAARDRSLCGPTAPAAGLFLHEVDYS